MKNKLKIIAIFASFLTLGACMNKSSVYENPQFHRFASCKVTSFGVISTLIAASYYERCKTQLENKGYMEVSKNGN